MEIRDRIKEFRRIKGAELHDNPKNWREHPPAQQTAMLGILREVGVADVLLVRETDEGYQLIDGHLRRNLEPDVEWPCAVLDVDEVEADLILATHDPLAAMAEQNDDRLRELLDSFSPDSEELQKMLDDLKPVELVETSPDSHYTNRVIAPIYEPKGEKPPLSALIDRGKTLELMAEIDAAELPEGVKEFLRLAAERHTVFNFRQIAEFYCHADETLQDLMERSGLVIIDFDKAIEYGFVHMTERLGELADIEENDGDA